MLDTNKILFSKQEIEKRISEMGQQITEDYRYSDKSLCVIAMLKIGRAHV